SSSRYVVLVSFSGSAAHRDLHSFPTRRSSDLGVFGGELVVQRLGVVIVDQDEAVAKPEGVVGLEDQFVTARRALGPYVEVSVLGHGRRRLLIWWRPRGGGRRGMSPASFLRRRLVCECCRPPRTHFVFTMSFVDNHPHRVGPLRPSPASVRAGRPCLLRGGHSCRT